MPPPGAPHDEAGRVAAVHGLGLLDSRRDEAFQALVRVASTICETPIAAVTLIDERRQWFLASVGLDGLSETPREVAFCAHTIAQRQVMVVEDAELDERFAQNPLVVGGPKLRFYAGCPLVDKAGYALGALCVLDQTPRQLSPHQERLMRELATAMVRLLEARRVDEALFVAERAEKRALADLALVLDAVPGAVSYWDGNHLNRFVNGVFADWFGRSGARTRGRHLREVIGDELYALHLPHLERALRGEPQRFDVEMVDAAGKKRHGSVFLTPDVRDGTTHGVVSTISDVTDLNDALRSSERRTELLRLAEEIAEVGHWRLDHAEKKLYWSAEVFRVHGLDPAEFAPTLASALEVYHPDDREKISSLVQRAIEEQEPYDAELRIIRSDGAVRRVHSRARCEVDPVSGRTRALVGVFQDITEREALRDKLMRQERLLTTGTLAAGVGHEINNPLTYVNANIEFAIDGLHALAGPRADGKLQELVEVLEEAREGAARIAMIVRGLRAFARESSPLGPVDVHAALEAAVNLAAPDLGPHVTIVRELASVPPVLGDTSRVVQVLANLIANAADSFASDDLAKNRIVLRTSSHDAGHVAIEVDDNGTGIRPEVLPRIFDPFFTTKAVGEGTGLGLATCHSLVTSLDGQITCTTEVGRGTSFRVVLPLAGKTRTSRAPRTPPLAKGKGARVLIVDDDEAVLRALTRVLGHEHRVTCVADPREALAAIDAGDPFDLVLCDLMMPHLSGMDLFRHTRDRRPPLAERFVFITGGTIHQEVRSFLEAVPNKCLEKPFNLGELRSVARRFATVADSPT